MDRTGKLLLAAIAAALWTNAIVAFVIKPHPQILVNSPATIIDDQMRHEFLMDIHSIAVDLSSLVGGRPACSNTKIC